MLLIGWSGLEGVGAALILPAIVALVASNFGRDERPRAYGLVASAGAIAVAEPAERDLAMWRELEGKSGEVAR